MPSDLLSRLKAISIHKFGPWEDKKIWLDSSNGDFNNKSTYSLIGQKRIDPLWWINWLISQVFLINQINMQMCGSTNKSPIKLSVAENKLTRWFVYECGKPTWQKPHRVILKSPLLKFHYYHNKRLQVKESQYLIPTYSWTLTPIPNWTCSVVTISPFDARLLVRD